MTSGCVCSLRKAVHLLAGKYRLVSFSFCCIKSLLYSTLISVSRFILRHACLFYWFHHFAAHGIDVKSLCFSKLHCIPSNLCFLERRGLHSNWIPRVQLELHCMSQSLAGFCVPLFPIPSATTQGNALQSIRYLINFQQTIFPFLLTIHIRRRVDKVPARLSQAVHLKILSK